MGNDKWSLFDFCETLVTFQTADAYVHYIRRKTGNRRMILLDGLHRLLKTFRVVNLAERITGNKRSINNCRDCCTERHSLHAGLCRRDKTG